MTEQEAICKHEYEWTTIENKRPSLCGVPGAGLSLSAWWYCKLCGDRLVTEAERDLNARFLKHYEAAGGKLHKWHRS